MVVVDFIRTRYRGVNWGWRRPKGNSDRAGRKDFCFVKYSSSNCPIHADASVSLSSKSFVETKLTARRSGAANTHWIRNRENTLHKGKGVELEVGISGLIGARRFETWDWTLIRKRIDLRYDCKYCHSLGRGRSRLCTITWAHQLESGAQKEWWIEMSTEPGISDTRSEIESHPPYLGRESG